jgi:lipopolysaccharide transport system ATP-binding protein
MTDIAIRVENLSKRYRIGLKEEVHDTLFAALADFVRQPIKNLRRLSRFEENGYDSEDIIWALKDVSFEVKRGEVAGIIGRNGAGKTTLASTSSAQGSKSSPASPTQRRATPRLRRELSRTIQGRVGSLLEACPECNRRVGTGFHPELTGRENIYLNGAIPSTMLRASLGMKRAETCPELTEGLTASSTRPVLSPSSLLRTSLPKHRGLCRDAVLSPSATLRVNSVEGSRSSWTHQ